MLFWSPLAQQLPYSSELRISLVDLFPYFSGTGDRLEQPVLKVREGEGT